MTSGLVAKQVHCLAPLQVTGVVAKFLIPGILIPVCTAVDERLELTVRDLVLVDPV